MASAEAAAVCVTAVWAWQLFKVTVVLLSCTFNITIDNPSPDTVTGLIACLPQST